MSDAVSHAALNTQLDAGFAALRDSAAGWVESPNAYTKETLTRAVDDLLAIIRFLWALDVPVAGRHVDAAFRLAHIVRSPGHNLRVRTRFHEAASAAVINQQEAPR